jgi:C_GCAxxG_C_C family probable redox protein
MVEVEGLVEKVGRLAHYHEHVYHGCAQCVLKALQDSLSLGDNLTFKAASALAGGVARMGETCGALLGGIMAISLAYGRDRLEETTISKGYLKAITLSIRFFEKFKEEFESIKCTDIQEKLFGRSFDLKKEEDRKEFVEAGGYEPGGCPKVVKKAAMLAAEIILKEG